MFETSDSPRNTAVVHYDYSTYEKNNYTTIPPTFSENYTEFEWWKSKMYNHIICLDDKLWDILKDGINIPVNGLGMVTDKKKSHPCSKEDL